LLKKTSQLLFSKNVHGRLKSTNRLNSGTIVRLFGPMIGPSEEMEEKQTVGVNLKKVQRDERMVR
jgi:hypothetical protein